MNFLSLNSLRSFLFKIQKITFPIKKSELPRFISIAMMMFCVLFVQNMIRAIKDSIVNTMIGVQSVAFLKLYGVVPMSILFTAMYIKMVSRMSASSIFYTVLSTFTIFFFVFGFIIFPNHEFFHMDTVTTQDLIARFVHLKWFIMLISTWSFGLFYIIAELWPTAVFGLLCWQFINSITTVEQSKRFYVMFGLITQTGMVICGQILSSWANITVYIRNIFGSTAHENVLFVQTILGLSCFFCLGAMFFFRYINKNIITQDLENENQQIKFKPKSSHKGLLTSLKYVFTSPYILLITTMLLCYGLSVNLVEAQWKSILVKKYPSPAEYGAFVGQYLTASGVLTIVFVLIGSNIIRHLGWISGALFTPIAMTITGMMFFLNYKFLSPEHVIGAYFGVQDQVMLLIYWGMQHNIVTKASKYTLFDSTKEMAYVPLDSEMKTKGKAAADMVGSKLGKSLSSFLQASIFTIFPHLEYEDIVNYMIVIFIIVCGLWFYAVFALNNKYLRLAKSVEKPI